MHAVKRRGPPPHPPPHVTALQYDTTLLSVRVADGSRPHRVTAQATGPWARFEQIGLGPPATKPLSRPVRVALAGYRFLGFAVLAVIVVVLIGYLATTAFFLVNRTWVAPTVVSPTDDRVVALQAELTMRQTQRDRIATELAQAELAVEAEQRFQLEFANAIKTDLAGRQAALARVKRLARDAASTRKHIHATNRTYAARHASKLAREYSAGLVDRSGMMSGKFRLAEISGSSLSLAERQAELDTRAAELAAAVAGLGSLIDEQAETAPLSYDVLTIKRDFDASRLALAKAHDTYAMLVASLRRQELLIENLEQSAYLRAIRDDAAVAVVPYDNLEHVRKDTKLYACRAAMVWCREVGYVLAVLPGEVTVQHPHRDRQLRGRMIELRLADRAAARNEVLFAGGAPLWL